MRRVAVLAALFVVAGCSSTSGRGSSSTAASTASSSRASATPKSLSSSSAPTTTRSAATTSSTAHRVAPKLTALRVAALTWVGDEGWALGEANCLSGRGRCAAIEHTGDGGRTWASLPAPSGARVLVPDVDGTSKPCSEPCLTSLRFATPKIGYAFGARALFTTADGALTWHRQPGGADALETLDGTVIRVVHTYSCPPGCAYRIQLAPIGATTWHPVSLPGGTGAGDGVRLVRTGRRAVLESYGNRAGGASAKAVLFTSADDGRTWWRHGEPCPQVASSGFGNEVDSTDVTAAPDGSLAVLCSGRGPKSRQFLLTSTDGGSHFHSAREALGAAYVRTIAAASARILVLSTDDTYRSTDGGNHFVRLSGNAGSSPGLLAYLGFASNSVGHGISADRRYVWTTRDAGRTWTGYRFP